MKMRLQRLATVSVFVAASLSGAAPSGDKLGRGNPRASVTGFLQACRGQRYDLASQYLDLNGVAKGRGPELARRLEAVLNSAPDFTVLDLTRNPEGSSPGSDTSPRERVAAITQNGVTYTLDLERIPMQPGGPLVWVFSPDAVTAALKLNPSAPAPWWVHYLPRFMTSVAPLETPLWKWAALTLAAILLISLSRLLDRLLTPGVRTASRRLLPSVPPVWAEDVISPIRVLLSVAVFRAAEEVVRPSAVAGLYVGGALELIVVWAIALCLVRIVDLFLDRVETNMAARRNFSGRSILRLGRRTASVTIIVISILTILSGWGYNTATLVAGLGVGGIAVALAAQQTIANIFGGISIIGDRPVVIGDFGKFGDLIGTVEDIGMRSTRVRTLNRTLVCVPNTAFAGANLENYSKRDKILFNTTLQIKRSTPDEQVWQLIESLNGALKKNPSVEVVPTPARLTALTAAAFSVEIFCYALTPDIDQFYRIQGELLLAINGALEAAHVELAP
jgi:MscS family membrane protein